MFQEQTARRYLEGSAQKIRTVAPTYLASIVSKQISIYCQNMYFNPTYNGIICINAL